MFLPTGKYKDYIEWLCVGSGLLSVWLLNVGGGEYACILACLCGVGVVVVVYFCVTNETETTRYTSEVYSVSAN